jgi:signal peptidase I
MGLSSGKGAAAAQRVWRSPWLAALLSLFLPGLGHIYVGCTRRGLAVFGALVAWPWLFFFLICQGRLPRLWLFAALMALLLALVFFALIDPALKARQAAASSLNPCNLWHCAGPLIAGWVISAIPCVAAYQIPASGYFQVPSPSMEPTLHPGEVFLADPAYYRSHTPARGEVVIYVNPKHPAVHHIKRIAALGGDRIAVRAGRAIVNGVPVDEPYIEVGDPEFFLNNVQEETVPPGHVYVLGDNRANSSDSRNRAEHGPVPVKSLVARATEIVFSPEVSRIGRWIGTPSNEPTRVARGGPRGLLAFADHVTVRATTVAPATRQRASQRLGSAMSSSMAVAWPISAVHEGKSNRRRE